MKWGVMCVALGVAGSVAVHAVPVVDQRQATQEQRLSAPGVAGPRISAATTSASSASLSFEPNAVYDRHCVICHAAGVAGAPMLGDEGAWASRVGQGLDVLVAHVVEGYNAMPAKGTCMNCTEEHIRDTVTWMLEQ